MKVLADFGKLRPAEERLVDWLQAGNRKTCIISGGVPDSATEDVTLRATFIRYLALGGCDACCLPETGLRVAGAYIEGDETRNDSTKGVDLDGATLFADLTLFDCRLPDRLLLRGARIKSLFLDGSCLQSGMSADRLHAEGGVFFRDTTIYATASLAGARLGQDLDFSKAIIKSPNSALRCDGLHADGAVILKGATIFGAIRLHSARIGADLICTDAYFSSKKTALHCDGLQAKGSVSLNGSRIAGSIVFAGIQLGGDLGCDAMTIVNDESMLHCDGARVAGTLYLDGGSRFASKIDITDARFSAIVDDPNSWPRVIRLDRCRYGAFLGNLAPTDAKHRLDWLSRIPTKPGEFWPDPYEHCAKVLREMGHGAEATKILIEKERLQRAAQREREARELSILRANVTEPLKGTKTLWHKTKVVFGAVRLWAARKWDSLLGFLVGYGRKPLYALWRGLLPIWAIGTVIFFATYWLGQIKPNLPQTQVHPAWVECADWGARRWQTHETQVDCFRAQPEGASYPQFNALFYSADTLFPVVTLEMQSYWIPDDTKPFGKYARWYLWVHIIAGWALTLLAVAGFSGLIKTDNTK